MKSERTHRERASYLPLALGMALVAGGAVALTRGTRRGSPHADQARRALVTYLREHLAGADAAIRVVERLRQTQIEERALFEWLGKEFQADRAVVLELLAMLGASSRSPRRLIGEASGAVLQHLAGGSAGELSLFRTLEALSIGVQGKQCLWRALDAVQPPLPLPGTRTVAELDAAAARQWDAIERRRLALVPSTFGAVPSRHDA